jgi:imidazoleglycerol phosphate dehydratase HisB
VTPTAGAARIDPAGDESQVATGVAVLDHLLEELAAAGRFGLLLEIAPDEPEAEVGLAGRALGDALRPLLEGDDVGLADAAGLTIHVRLIEGENSQHVLSAIFKALGSALRDATRGGS